MGRPDVDNKSGIVIPRQPAEQILLSGFDRFVFSYRDCNPDEWRGRSESEAKEIVKILRLSIQTFRSPHEERFVSQEEKNEDNDENEQKDAGEKADVHISVITVATETFPKVSGETVPRGKRLKSFD